MNFFDSWIFTILMIAAYLYASYRDIQTSIVFPEFGGLEGVSIRRDKYGYFSIPKEFIISGILLGLTVVFHFLEPKSWVLLLGGTVARFAISFHNAAKNENCRELQIQYLDQLQSADPENYEAFLNFFPSVNMPRKFVDGRLWIPLFAKLATGWIYEEAKGADDYEALYRLTKRIWLIAQLPNEKRFAN
jgi:hypothetical protein